jgi:hypothetical protein
LVEYFKQAAKLHYSHRKEEDVKLTFQYGKENGVNLSHTWVKNECAVNMRLRRMRRPCVGENMKVLVSLDLQV